MLMTFAELQFVLTRAAAPEVPLMDLLGLEARDDEAVAAAGGASLLVRELARSTGDSSVEFVAELDAIATALHDATCVHQLAVTSTNRAQAWHVVSSLAHRVAISPLGMGLMGAVVLEESLDLDEQVAGLISAALAEDPHADVAVRRVTADADTVGALTAAELAHSSNKPTTIVDLVRGVGRPWAPDVGRDDA